MTDVPPEGALNAGPGIESEGPPEARPSGVLYVDRGRLLVATLFDAITTTTPLALHPSGDICSYRDGRYDPDRHRLAWLVAERLTDHFKPDHVRNLTAYGGARLTELGLVVGNAPGRLINLANGMLDPLTSELRPHGPEYLSLAQWPVSWDPDAACPTFDSWLRDVLPNDELRAALIEDAGTLLDLRGERQKRALFLAGPPRSGKSTFARLLEGIVGTANRSGEELAALATNKFRAAELFGKALNVASDISAAHLADVGLFKKATGQDTISAEHKFGHPFTFRFQGLFVFTMNDVPSVSDHSGSYLARIRPYRFPVSFAGREDPRIEVAMLSELPGVLRQLVAGLQRIEARNGYRIDSATDSEARWFARQSDQVLLFLDEATTPVGWTPCGRVHEAYRLWASDRRRGVMGRNELYGALRAAGHPVVRIHGGARGFRLTMLDDYDEAAADDDEPPPTRPRSSDETVESVTLSRGGDGFDGLRGNHAHV